MPVRRLLVALTMVTTLLASGCASKPPADATAPLPAPTPGFEPRVGQAGKDVIWVPTPQALVDRMLDMAALKPGDRLVDLGSGDGRTVISAAKRGIRAHGIEFNADMVEIARRQAQREGVSDRATFERADLFATDFSSATVVTMFLLPNLNNRLKPVLLAMKPGTRIVSNSFDIDQWQADEVSEVRDDCLQWCTAYQWIVPARVAGDWTLEGAGAPRQLSLKQDHQMLEGELRDGDRRLRIEQGRLVGDEIRFVAAGQRYAGKVDGARIRGVEGPAGWTARR